jgi:hypothetical protein
MIAESFIPVDRLALIEEQAIYDDTNQMWVIPYVEKAGRHQKVEEVEEQNVFILGIDGPMRLSQKALAIPAAVDVKKAAQALKKRKIAAQHALNEFALVPELVAAKPK